MSKKFKVQGIVKHLTSHQGISDLVVVAIDIDFQQLQQESAAAGFEQRLLHDRLGSVLTDASGRFYLQFTEADFSANDADRRPEILLLVMAPEISRDNPFDINYLNALSLGPNVLHVSPPIRMKAGKIESYSVRIDPQALSKFQLDQPAQVLKPDTESLTRGLLEKRAYTADLLGARSADLNDRMLRANEALVNAADELFATFTLSTVSAEIRGRDTFFDSDKDLATLQRNIIGNKLSEFDSRGAEPMAVTLLPETIRELDILDSAGGLRPEFGIERIWDWWQRANDTILERRRNAYQRCIEPFREGSLDETTPATDTSDTPDGSGDEPEAPPAMPDTLLDDKTNALINCATCPEEPLRYSKVVDPNYRELDLRETINGLELIAGPTDVTSYHDFESIQIAFESIWSEVFDNEIETLGRELYAEIVRTADDTCADRLVRASRLNLSDPASLKSLLSEFRHITGGRVNKRVEFLYAELEQRLTEPYKFDVFAENSYNYGVVYTFRQKWEPQTYQVGRLVKTIPLAPKEMRRYKTKVSRKLTSTQKVLEDREFKGSSESASTSRAESEIVSRASNKNSFSTNAEGQLDMQMYKMQFGTETGMESEKFSSSTKKNFRESVLKAAQEYRKQTKLEVETVSEETFESTSSGEITNPNEEISVTYLFYELQRQFLISEQLHRITPIISVAFAVPKPHEIDNDWLMTHAWIIRRVLLDESFHAALDYLTSSIVGSEIALQEMGEALKRQQKLVDELNAELEIRNRHVDDIMNRIVALMTGDAVVDTIKDTADFIHGIVNPLSGLFGGGGDSGPDLEKFKEVLELQLERSEKEQQRLVGRLKESQSDLQSITQKYGEMSRRHFDQQTAVAQLRIHVKENILYYMQAIWDYEPPDQRYFRLYDLEVEWFEDPGGSVSTSGLVPRLNPDTGEIEWIEGDIFLPIGGIRRETRKLVDVADIDNLLGFKGNYAIFPVKDPNYLHLHMMKDYIDTQTGGLRDPDKFADISTQDLIDYLKCVRRHQPDVYEREKDDVIDLINERQRRPRREKELVVVPTDSLYIECLPGKHPVLEDFKLVHRAMDVKKVQAEIRKLELENLRYAERLLADETSDPEVDKQIRVSGVDAGLDVET